MSTFKGVVEGSVPRNQSRKMLTVEQNFQRSLVGERSYTNLPLTFVVDYFRIVPPRQPPLAVFCKYILGVVFS